MTAAALPAGPAGTVDVDPVVDDPAAATALTGELLPAAGPAGADGGPDHPRDDDGDGYRVPDGLGEALSKWLARQRSQATIRAYRGDAVDWLAWCARCGLDPLTVEDAHLNAWRHVLEDRGYAAATRARKLAAVVSWYTWLRRRGVVDVDLADTDAVPRPRAGESRTVGLTDAQAKALLAAADADGHHAAALIAVLLYAGPRVGELAALDVDDYYPTDKHRVLHLRGKGGKERRVPLVAPAQVRVDAHLAARADVAAAALPVPVGQAGARPRLPLLVTTTGRRLYQSYVWYTVRRLAKAAGGDLSVLADKLSPHSIRHTTITSALAAGVPLHRVQDLAGHRSADTTRGYDRRRGELHNHAVYRLDFEPPRPDRPAGQ